jgi:hypothetical protein
MSTTQNAGTFSFKTTIDPPQVRIPLALEGDPNSKWHQSQADVLYQIWDALIKLGTSNSTIIDQEDITETFIVACSDESTFLTTGIKKAVFHAPYNCTLEELMASLTTSAVGTTLLKIDIGINGTSILSTKLTFDSGESTTLTAATPHVITSNAIAKDDEIRIDILAVGSSVAGAGLKVTFKLKQAS